MSDGCVADSQDADNTTYLWLNLAIQIQMILILCYALVRCVICPLLGRDDGSARPTAEQVAKNTAALLERAATKKIERAAMIQSKLKALAAPLDALTDAAFLTAPANELFRQCVAAQTLCPFAKKSVVWADPVPMSAGGDADDLEAEALAAVPALARWSLLAQEQKLDGFVFARQLPRDRFVGGTTSKPTREQIESGDVLVYNLAAWLRCTLHALSLQDPGGNGRSTIVQESEHQLDGQPTGHRGWRFQFGDDKFFITTFTPAYAPDHPRHAVGDTSFILFQPDFSFSLHHDIGPDHPRMPADAPPETWSVRERVRRRFTAAHRTYYVPNAHSFPQAILYVPHRDAKLAEEGWHWRWWLPEPTLGCVENQKKR
jgi:hypothetical protein